jgi:mannose-6-phosphate isomerase-like protein (cupin superfamily)
MPPATHFVTQNRAVYVANDNGPLPANIHHLPPMVQVGVRRNALSALVLFVEEGIVEFMIGGASGFVTAGGFVRIPADTPYAYRNPGDETARLVSRAVGPSSAESAA